VVGVAIGWEGELSALKARLGSLFGRRELRETAAAFLDGVLSASRARPGGCWPNSRERRDRIGCNRCSGGAGGKRTS
jgi:hypothetical protein